VLEKLFVEHIIESPREHSIYQASMPKIFHPCSRLSINQ